MSSRPWSADVSEAGAARGSTPGRLVPTRLAAAAAALGVLGILSAFVVVGGLLGLVLGALTLVFVAAGVSGLVLGFRALGSSGGGAGAPALAAIVGGAVALLLALLLVVLVALPVGAFFTRYSDELSDLDQCVKAATGDQTKILACQDDFARKVKR